MNTCKTCQRQDVDEINLMLSSGKPLRYIVDNYKIPQGSVQRHKDNCLNELFAEVREQKRAGLLADVDKLNTEIAAVRTKFEGNPNVRVQLLARHRDAIDLEAKLTGAYIKEATNPVDVSAVASEIADRLVSQGVMSVEEARERVSQLYPELVSKAVN